MTLERRVSNATPLLRKAASVYADCHEQAETDLSTQPRNRTVGVRVGQPSSKEPPAGDAFQRRQCVEAARLLFNAHEVIGGLRDTKMSHQLGDVEEVVVCKFHDGEAFCTVHLEWDRNPTDLAIRLPSPEEFRVLAQSLAGLIGWLSSRGYVAELERVLGYIDKVERTLRDTGNWEAAHPECVLPDCANLPERDGDKYRAMCSKHRKAAQRSRAA